MNYIITKGKSKTESAQYLHATALSLALSTMTHVGVSELQKLYDRVTIEGLHESEEAKYMGNG